MRNPIAIAAALLLAAAPLHAQDDAAALLRKAATAMGTENLKTLRYTGSGTGAQFGQAFHPTKPWPKLNYPSYERLLDYPAQASVEIVTRSRAEPTGGGAVPLTGEARAGGAVNGAFAWNLAGPTLAATPRQPAREARLHDLWITPHGAVMAAARNHAKVRFVTERGRELAAVSFTESGILSATVYFNDGYLVERVESRMPDPVLGDTPVVTTYSDYRAFGGVWFPMRIR